MKSFILCLLAALLIIPNAVSAADPTVEDLQKQIAEISKKLEKLNDELDDRIRKPERHAAMDRINFYGDLRVTADSLHYQDVTFSPGILVDYDDFAAKVMAGTFGSILDPTSPIGQMMAQYPDLAAAFMAGQLSGIGYFPMADAAKKSDINNDILFTTRLRLGMKAKIADNMDFSGRLTMYKNWGDSTTSKVFDSWNAFTMDGTDGGSTSGDWLRVERAYFDWRDIADSNFYLSVGRRPSGYGPPTQFRENEPRGGTPSGHLVQFNFDGITVGYHMSEVTGIEGQSVRFCYGQGFESEWGNGDMFADGTNNNLEDTHLGGFNIDLYNDGKTFIQTTLFRAQDVVDGFKGTIAFPTQYAQLFAPTMYSDLQKFPTFNFEVRYTPTTVIGDINLLGLGFSREEDNGLVWFGSVAMTQLESNGEAGMFGGMGSDAVYQATLSADGSEIYMEPVRAEDDGTHEGYGIYLGIQVPAPLGKFGLEYNYGSQYWTPFTQAQDDLLGSKLATRGHVGEAYYIFEINRNAFIKIGGLYYDYEYTNSGSPVGKPQKIDDIKNSEAYSLLPVVDKAWDLYAKMTLRF